MNIQIPLRTSILICFCAVAALPLLTSNGLFYPSPWAQAMVFRIIISLLLALFILLLFQKPSPKTALVERLQSAKQVLLALGFFAVVLVIATLFSEDFYFSFWGTPSRGWGILTYFLLIAFTIVAFLLLSDKDWGKVWATLFLSGTAVAAIAIFQTFDLFSSLFTATGGGKAPGTLGSSLVLGLYLLLFAFAALAFKKFPFFFLFGATTLLTFSRSAWLGLFVGILVFLLLYPGKQKLVRIIAFLVLIGGLVIVVGANTLTLPSSLATHPVILRAWERLQWEHAIDQPRLLAWRVDLPAIAEKPLVGWGPYNSSIPFNKHFDPVITTQTKVLGYFDTSHNYYLDLALGSGLLGLATYLFFLGALLWRLRRVPEEKQWEARSIQSALVGSHTTLLFFPYVFPTYLISFFLVAYALHITAQKPALLPSQSATIPFGTKKRIAYLAISLTLLLFSFFTAFQPLLLNRSLNLGARLAETGFCRDSIPMVEDLKRKSGAGFFSYWINLQYVETISACILYQNEAGQQELSEKAVSALKAQLNVRAVEPRTWIFLGGYLTNLAAFTENPQEQTDFLQQAKAAFQQAERLSPARYEIFAEWARTGIVAKDYETAREKTLQCLSLNSQFKQCLLWRALSELHLGNVEEGMAALQTAQQEARLQLGGQHEAIIQQMIQVLISLPEKPYKHIATLYDHLTRINPKNPQYYAALADAYLHLEKYESATALALHVLKLQPENTEGVKEFLLQIPPESLEDLQLDWKEVELLRQILPEYVPLKYRR